MASSGEISPKQRPGETIEEYVERLQARLLATTREKEEALKRGDEERREKEEALKREDEERREKEKALKREDEERREKEEALKRGDEERREKEEALKRGDEERREKEEALQRGDEERREKEEAIRQVLPQPFMAFMEQMEDAVFSAFLVQRVPSKAATTSVTDVSGKMYPRCLRSWDAFAERHTATFNAMRESLGDSQHFMSRHAIEAIGSRLGRAQAIADENDTRPFIRTAIEEPAIAIVTAYLQTLHPETPQSIQFENNAYNKLGDGQTPASKRYSPTKDLKPDRWVFLFDERTREANNIAIGEIKPPHKVKVATLQKVMAAVRAESFFSEAIWGLEILQRQSQDQDAQPVEAAQQAASASTVTGETVESSTGMVRTPGHVLVAQALCQAYHYMIGSGCEYGYVMTGDSLILLRVTEDTPDDLLYHCAHFPVPHVQDAEERRRKNHGLRQPHETAAAHLASLCIWASQAPARRIGWIDRVTKHALRWPKSEERKLQATLTLNRRADDDEGGNDGGASGSDAGGPEGPGDAGGPDGSGGAGGPDGGAESGSGTPRLPLPSAPRKRERSPTRRHGLADQGEVDWAASPPPLPPPRKPFGPILYEPPLLPYCTQACLVGLVRGLPLDQNCPNVALHRAKQLESRPAGTADAKATAKAHSLDCHPLTVSDLGARIVAQMQASLDKDCECLLQSGQWGRYGVLFKLAVTGYGYTFVGKSVEAENVGVLHHEAAVYRALRPLQGVLIPVFLGIVDLQRKVPLNNLAVVTHLMLMSYAGPDLTLPKRLEIPDNVDLAAESHRTVTELELAGVYNQDVREANLAWNAEVGRVMSFDFDLVNLDYLLRVRGHVGDEDKGTRTREDRGHETDRGATVVKAEPDVPEPDVPEPDEAPRSPLLDRKDWNGRMHKDKDGDGNQKDDGRARKRIRMTNKEQ